MRQREVAHATMCHHAPGEAPMHLHASRRHIKRDCPKYKAQDQSLDTVATTVMADDDESDVLLAASADGKSDWVLDSGSAYHLCRDREMFSTYAPCEGRVWMANNTASGVVGKGSVQFCMADGRSVTLTERNSESFQGKQGNVIGKEDWKAIPIGGECPDRGSYCPTWVQWYWQKELTRKATIAQSAGCPKRSSEEGDQVDFEKLYSEGRSDAKMSLFHYRFDQWRSYWEAGSEAVKMDNLKTSDYPLVSWRGILLSPAHLDESKPTWMSPNPVAKPKLGWSLHGVSM
ncbi:hypothetical protein Acr_00g0079830 [Actinidia rufa]|uniref:Retrovirus-related Pol polyprotein from transposon TNT 1-94-like beta-barrel domain-containing protein n=1 Tax=Actinidia rufa TaxID=165716 RepID=A0A7J0DWC4_9ERIC|nr:hypothetical protein Acr_00g0079830 [Actinidia rufa]